MKSFKLLPLVTEKSMAMASTNVYQFVVPTWASKPEIKRVIGDLFKVTVIECTTARYTASTRRFKQVAGKTAMYKKASVTLKKGETIKDFSLPVETESQKPAETKEEVKAEPTNVKTESTVTVRSKGKKVA